MATKLTPEENNVYVTLLAEGENLSFGEYLKLDDLAPSLKRYGHLEAILKKLDASNLIISKSSNENKFDKIRAISYEQNTIIICS